jgi:hypothetical protein
MYLILDYFLCGSSPVTGFKSDEKTNLLTCPHKITCPFTCHSTSPRIIRTIYTGRFNHPEHSGAGATAAWGVVTTPSFIVLPIVTSAFSTHIFAVLYIIFLEK